MINFKNVHIEGFCSIGSLSLPLNERGTVLIKAPNGYGKSSILSAIIWALYGKNIKGTSNVNTWKKYRTKDYCGTKVEVYFEVNNHIHKVIRCSNYTQEVEGAKGSNRLIYLIDAIQVDEKSKIQLQNLIIKNLGMSYQLFMNSIMFGQGLKRLIQESGSDKKQLFEEIFELNYISRAREIAISKYKDVDSIVRGLSSDKVHNDSSISTLEENLEDIVDKEKYLKEKEDTKREHLIRSIESKQEELNGLLSEFNEKAYEKLESTLEKYKLRIKKQQDILRAAKNKSNIPLEELIDKVIKLLREKDYNSSLNTLLEVKKAFTSIEKSRKKIDSLQDRSSKVSNELYKLNKLASSIRYCKESLNGLRSTLSSITTDSNEDFEDIKSKTKEKLRILKKKNKGIIKEIERHSSTRELYKWAYTDPLGSNGIKAFLFESSLGFLNEVLESYSEVLGFSIQFIVDLESTRKDFQTVIYMDGIEVQYDELSGGQKQLCNLAMAFAMNEVMTQAKGISIAFLDEVFENLSQDNIEIVVGLIKKVYKDKTLFLITHQESLPISNSKTLKVQRIKGISHYQY